MVALLVLQQTLQGAPDVRAFGTLDDRALRLEVLAVFRDVHLGARRAGRAGPAHMALQVVFEALLACIRVADRTEAVGLVQGHGIMAGWCRQL